MRTSGEIDWNSVFARVPDIMGLSGLKMRGRKWYGPYRIDGSGHHRWDKMNVIQHKQTGAVFVAEEGGDCISLWKWLVQYGRMTNGDVGRRLRGVEFKELVFEPEYEGECRYIEAWRVIEQGGADKKYRCPLFKWMSGEWGADKVADAFNKYHVSAGLVRDGVLGTRFWYKDIEQRWCFDKSMWYKPDGHRIKDLNPARYYKRKYGYKAECLFGEDSLVPGRSVFVVESEKTAIICHLEYPDFNWVACGGKNGLKRAKERLQGWEMYLVPDVDAVSEWEQYGRVWRWWQKAAEEGIILEPKWDLADYILEKRRLRGE